MAQKRCGGCGKAYRTGTLIYVSDGAGGIGRKRVGPCCASRAVPVLVGTIEAGRCKCGAAASTCMGCAVDGDKKDTKKIFEKAIKKLKGVADAYQRTFGGKDEQIDFTIAGLEQAVDILEGGDFR